jgi:hypothetical protein
LAFRAEILRREKMQDANARVRVLVQLRLYGDPRFQPLNPFPHIASLSQNLANQLVLLKCCRVADEVSGLVAFLTFDRASFITGGRFDIDGGV